MAEHSEAESLAGTPHDAESVLAELDRILQSSAFRNAKRSQEFLRYIVTNTLAGRTDRLKERVIGQEIFQRPPDYDTGEDSIVRVKASELRRRLAQFYHEASPSGVEIEIPVGSYMPELRLQKPPMAIPGFPAPAAPAEPRRRAVPALVVGAALTVALLIAVPLLWWNRVQPAQAALDAFWAPVYRSSSPVLLCVAQPVVYWLAERSRAIMEQSPPRGSIPAEDLTRTPDYFLGFGDALALANVTGFLRAKGRPVQVRMAHDVSFLDLRSAPTVLIGAFTNDWTMQMTNNLRYVFDKKDARSAIRDQMNPQQAWHFAGDGAGSDYALISRIFDSRSGNVIVIAAGLGHLGTQMAGEFLTNSSYMEQLVRNAPADWRQRNMQVVLWGEVIGRTVGPPRIMASWYW